MNNNRFVVIVPFYNVENTIQKTINSILKQEYKNYTCILIDDISTDQSYQRCKETIKNNNSFILLKNKEKKYSTKNIYESIHNYTDNDDIIVILDGDDFFYGNDVLSYLNNFYNNNNCLLTYGSYVELASGIKGKFARRIPDEVIERNSYREYPWCTSHLRSFRSFLYKRIKEKDFLDRNGNFYTRAGDLVIMYPMLEMAGKKAFYIDKILYIWNNISELNEHKVDHSKQLLVEQEVRNKEKYEPII